MNDLQDFRKSIDLIDSAIISLLAERMRVVLKVGKFKKERNLPPLDEKRWKEVLDSKISLGKGLDLPEEFIVEIWNIIHKFALKLEK